MLRRWLDYCCWSLVRAFRRCPRWDSGGRRLRGLLCRVCHGSNDPKAHEFAYKPPLVFYYYCFPNDIRQHPLVLTLGVNSIQLSYYPNQDCLSHAIHLRGHVVTLYFGFCPHQPWMGLSLMNDGAKQHLCLMPHGCTKHQYLDCS